MAYRVTKKYGHDLGLSSCFRQWAADSHCAYLHGYALSFELVFESEGLDSRNWVIDFGSLKWIKEFLVATFDHRLLIAADDPHLDELSALAGLGACDPVVLVNGVGCEAFAELVFWYVAEKLSDHVRLVQVTCAEHGANSATYIGEA